MDGNVITVERTIAAPPSAIFALLADAAKHSTFDGSGNVKDARSGGGEPLRLGSEFGMSMKMGLPYATRNTVVEYEQDRRIAWKTTVGAFGKFLGGRVWRYELEPVGDGTRVRESWDLSQEAMRPVLSRSHFPGKTKKDMERTLERIEQQLAPAASA